MLDFFKKQKGTDKTEQELLTILASAYNSLDLTELANYLSKKDFIYESQDVTECLRNSAELLKGLAQKFSKISENITFSKVYAELAVLEQIDKDIPKIPDYFKGEHQQTLNNLYVGKPCIITSQGDKSLQNGLIFIDVVNGLIRKIDLCSQYPPVEYAKGLNEFPKLESSNFYTLSELHNVGMNVLYERLQKDNFEVIQANNDIRNFPQFIVEKNQKVFFICLKTTYNPDLYKYEDDFRSDFINYAKENNGIPIFANVVVRSGFPKQLGVPSIGAFEKGIPFFSQTYGTEELDE